MKRVSPEERRSGVLYVIENSIMPVGVNTVLRRAKAATWITTKSILLELVVAGKINGEETSNGWVFWKK